MIKATRLIIHNIGLIRDETIDLNQPLMLFYGEVRQGKTTILNCFKYAVGAPWPEDIISHDTDEASVTFEFTEDGIPGSVSRSWYIGKNGPTAREISFIRGGKPVKPPTKELAKLLNPFLLDQDYLRNMTELQRRAFFVEFLNVDTKEYDDYYAKIDEEAKNLRATVKGYGEIDTTPYISVDVEALKAKLAEIRMTHDNALLDVETTNNAISSSNTLVERGAKSLEVINTEIAELEAQLTTKRESRDKIVAWLDTNKTQLLNPRPEAPDTSALEASISAAAANEVRVEQYKVNLVRAKQKESDEERILELETQKRDIKQQKADKLASISATCGIPGLTFDADGNMEFNGTSAGMLSTSEIMTLSSLISALYPSGLGVELLDRGESLGKSIFEFVDRAKAENKTILAAIVGERPATAPEGIGVFVVEKGEVKA
jgi:DNA repair exonuclease SbcCD ATPase subunit